MKKPTSKSVSAKRKTSSQSGRCAATGTTEKKRYDDEPIESNPFYSAIINLRKMTPKQFGDQLVKLGISTPDGQLTEKYR